MKQIKKFKTIINLDFNSKTSVCFAKKIKGVHLLKINKYFMLSFDY